MHLRQIASKSRWTLGLIVRGRDRLRMYHIRYGGHCRFTAERWPTGNQLIQDGSKRIDVTSRTNFSSFSRRLFGRHKAGCAHSAARICKRNVHAQLFRQTEISNLRLVLFIDEDIRWFQVSM